MKCLYAIGLISVIVFSSEVQADTCDTACTDCRNEFKKCFDDQWESGRGSLQRICGIGDHDCYGAITSCLGKQGCSITGCKNM